MFLIKFTIFGIALLCCQFSSACDSWIYSFNDSQYCIYETKHNFFGALQFCKFIGANLINIETMEENKYIEKILKERGTPTNDQQFEAFWTSGARIGDINSWAWLSNNEKIRSLFWGGVEPNNQDNQEYCLNVIVRKTGNYYFNDAPCNYDLPCICERKTVNPENLCLQAKK